MSDAERPPPATSPLALRALLCWPAGAALIGGFDAGLQSMATGFHGPSFVLAVALAGSSGLWLGLIAFALVSTVRRRAPSLERSVPWSPRLIACSLAALACTALAWWGAAEVAEIALANPVDYAETALRLWRSGLVFAIPVFTAFAYLAVRALEARLVPDHARLGRLAVSAMALLAVGHLCSGPFFVYLGAGAAFGLWIVASLACGQWIPRQIEGTRRNAAIVASVVVALVLATFARSHLGARTLLLHEARVSPHLLDTALGWADTDGDGDLPLWLGGGDCETSNPEVSSLRTETPANGVDDNCHLGDAPRVEPTASPARPGPRPPIFLITVDTLRADRLDLYGHERETMPALSAFADTARVWERAYAPANHTFFAIPSLLSGQSPERMIMPGEGALPRLRYTTWLPHELRQLGYRSVAINPPLVVDGKMSLPDLAFDHVEVGGFDQGAKNRGTTAKQVADTLITIVERYEDEAPLFCWVHFMDPHAVHESPVRFPVVDTLDAYDNELSWVDMHFNRMLAAIGRRYPQGALIVLTADHGESIGERGNYGHGFTLHEEEIRVPLLVAGPGIEPARVPSPVSAGAVSATILEQLGQGADSRFSWPSLLGDEAQPDPIAANPAFLWNEARMEVALIHGDWKLLHNRARNTTKLFDLASDPHERSNLAPREAAKRAELEALLWAQLETR